jgi:hypothetical protein
MSKLVYEDELDQLRVNLIRLPENSKKNMDIHKEEAEHKIGEFIRRH